MIYKISYVFIKTNDAFWHNVYLIIKSVDPSVIIAHSFIETTDVVKSFVQSVDKINEFVQSVSLFLFICYKICLRFDLCEVQGNWWRFRAVYSLVLYFVGHRCILLPVSTLGYYVWIHSWLCKVLFLLRLLICLPI